ncbi:NAD-dependent epimerase/dehydratase family protein [Pseudonocardia sp. GCM10023141]|uniref:NAD-dependent epimerase/dehydratase family protein n=1 Tax=Pseudonocardia sp. GCM10023141 TaxID=3252653 RepID=UPI0036093F5D
MSSSAGGARSPRLASSPVVAPTMRIAVTGAAGILGRRVIERASAAGHDVVAVDLPDAVPGDGVGRVDWRAADVIDLDAVRAALTGTDVVVHLGALTSPYHPEPIVHRTNVNGTHNVLVAAEELQLAAVCLASSVNAIGGAFSYSPRYDEFPITEDHPSYCEDSYSLSKLILEQQSAAFARRRPHVPFTALRLHALHDDYDTAARSCQDEVDYRHLWGWTAVDQAAAACLLAVRRRAPGHAVANIVAARTASATPSAELADKWFPEVPRRQPLVGNAGFYTTDAAQRLLGWDAHDEHPA